MLWPIAHAHIVFAIRSHSSEWHPLVDLIHEIIIVLDSNVLIVNTVQTRHQAKIFR